MSVSSAKRTACLMLIAAACLMLVCFSHSFAGGDSPGIRLPALTEEKKKIFDNGSVVIHYGNASQGYLMIKGKAGKKPLKVRIILNAKEYIYDLNGQGEFEVFPLQMGSGKYKVQVFQEAKKGMYANLASKNIQVELDDPTLPYLYPSQYVHYTADSKTVAKSFELCEGLNTDPEKVKAIFAFCANPSNIAYHHARAISTKAGYLPNPDEVLEEGMGICFDYAAVMATMLRVQGIPTQLVIGYADRKYHAWNHTLVDGKWYRYDATYAATGNMAQSYTEERHY